MDYPLTAIEEPAIPRSAAAQWQHAVDTYASETNKVFSVWKQFADADLGFRPHARSSSVGEILKHQLLSERRFFAEFLSLAEPPADGVMPATDSIDALCARFIDLARPRLVQLAGKTDDWWLQPVPFFDVRRERIWIFWRRVLHTAHHRTQLTVYLRLLDRPVVATYGPTADATWTGADPTLTVEAAQRRSNK